MKASLYIYSTPKYKANIVNNKTRHDAIIASISEQKTKWESIKSRQKNHLPKSIKKYVPFNRKKYNSLNDKSNTSEKLKIEP